MSASIRQSARAVQQAAKTAASEVTEDLCLLIASSSGDPALVVKQALAAAFLSGVNYGTLIASNIAEGKLIVTPD